MGQHGPVTDGQPRFKGGKCTSFRSAQGLASSGVVVQLPQQWVVDAKSYECMLCLSPTGGIVEQDHPGHSSGHQASGILLCPGPLMTVVVVEVYVTHPWHIHEHQDFLLLPLPAGAMGRYQLNI